MSFFIEHFWIWLVIAVLLGFAGVAGYAGTRNRKSFVVLETFSVVVFVAGFLVTNFVETDYKSISRTLTQLSRAIENDDLEEVRRFIQPSATGTRIKAETNMKLVRVSRAHFSNLEIEVNRFTSPPTASVSFHATVKYRWKDQAPAMLREFAGGTSEDVVRVRFSRVDLEKAGNSWLVGDRCEFRPAAM